MELLQMPLNLPTNPMFFPTINVRVRDTLYGGLKKPLLGTSSIQLDKRVSSEIASSTAFKEVPGTATVETWENERWCACHAALPHTSRHSREAPARTRTYQVEGLHRTILFQVLVALSKKTPTGSPRTRRTRTPHAARRAYLYMAGTRHTRRCVRACLSLLSTGIL